MLKNLSKFSLGSSVGLIGILGLAVSAVAQTPIPSIEPGHAYSEPESARALILAPAKIFTFFFVMLGPLKVLGPFARTTFGMDVATSRRLALKGIVIAVLAGVFAAFVGQLILVSWGLSLPSLLLTAGLVLLLIALRAVLAQYDIPTGRPLENRDIPDDPPKTDPLSLAFPTIVTPYGVAALILLLGASEGTRDLNIFGIFLAVMAINLVAMWFARPILKYASGLLQILGSVFGVLQVALAFQMILGAGRMLGVLPPV